MAVLAVICLTLLPCFLILKVKRLHHAPWFGLASRRDIILGTTVRYLSCPLIQLRLSEREQRYHASIFGRSGSGKSKLLQGIFLQHVRQGKGVGIIEPHHDLSFDCLASLIGSGFYSRHDPGCTHDDRHCAYRHVVYIDWANGGYIPFNILKSPAPHHTIAANVLDAFHRVWPSLGDGSAAAFDTIVERGIRVLLANALPLTRLERLVTDHTWRDSLLKNVEDEDVRHYWQTFFDHLSDTDKLSEIKSTIRRLSILTSSPLLKYTLGQRENALDFRSLMDQGRSIIINLGNVGDLIARKLIGALVMMQIEQAALSRTNQLPQERTPFTLLVDEWPAFAAQQDTISHILSQCRKFNLRLYLAAQSLAQVDSQRLVGALENCKLQIAFGLGRDSAETQAKHIGIIDPHLVKEEKAYESQHTMFTALNEQWELWTQELQNLKARWAYVKLEGVHAIKIRTLSVHTPKVSSEQLNEVLATYRSLYQKTQQEAEEAMADSEPTSQPAYHQLFD